MVLVRLYATLRMRAGDKSIEVAVPSPGTVRDLLRHLEELRPALAGRVLDEGGEVRRYVAVFINGREIQFLDGLDTAVDAADEVDVFPAVAGGGITHLRGGEARCCPSRTRCGCSSPPRIAPQHATNSVRYGRRGAAH